MALSKTIGSALALVVVAGLACAAGVEDFYKGRNVTLVIGYSVGGGYDAYARLLGRYFGKHIPGNPAIVPEQMTGAGSLRSANFIYSVAAKDGSVFGTFSRSMGISPLVDKAEFDSRKFTWLGSVTDDNTICVTWNTSPIKTWDDFLTKPSKFGGEGAGADPDIWTLLYKKVFGAKAQLVSGYPGTNDVVLAMERGEIDGLCGISWSTIKTRHPEWLSSHSVNIIVQAALKKLGLRVGDMSLFEINEAFAAVACTSMDLLGIDEQRVNVDGGALAVGHPIGASGARILMHLVYALRHRGGGYGAAGICSGMAQGEATIVRVN